MKDAEKKNSLMFSVEEMGKSLGISRAKAYELTRSSGFPKVRLGKRILIPIDGLKRWIELQTV